MTTLKSNLLKKGKKGFTLTELAIVIAVIAILIAVLVPTFTSIITKANVTAAAEEADHALTEYTIENLSSISDDAEAYVQSGDYYFKVSGGTITYSTEDTDYFKGTFSESDYVAYEWDTNGDYANSKITIYVKVEYAAANTDAFPVVNTAYSAAVALCNDSTNGATLASAVTSSAPAYVCYSNDGTVIWWQITEIETITSQVNTGTTYSATLEVVTGVSATTGTSSYTVTVGTTNYTTSTAPITDTNTYLTIYYNLTTSA